MTPNFGITPELVAMVKAAEKWVDHPYLCPAGWPTIGWGHVIPSMNHPKITMEQGQELLMADLRFARDQGLRLSPGLATEPERRMAAIIDFCFNLGFHAYGISTLRKCVDAKQWSEAGRQMRRWVYAHDKVTKKMIQLPGLVKRRGIASQWLEKA